MRVLALDYGAARCGCAISDPSGTIVTPLPAIEGAATRRGLGRLTEIVDEQAVELVVIGLPLTLAGREGDQAVETRVFAERLRDRANVAVELHDERLTTRLAERAGGTADADSRAAAYLLESWLAARTEAPA